VDLDRPAETVTITVVGKMDPRRTTEVRPESTALALLVSAVVLRGGSRSLFVDIWRRCSRLAPKMELCRMYLCFGNKSFVCHSSFQRPAALGMHL
jgi:hypothetical protein